jgi:hypothetical protein
VGVLRRRPWVGHLGALIILMMAASVSAAVAVAPRAIRAWAVPTAQGTRSDFAAAGIPSPSLARTSAAVTPSIESIGVLSPAGDVQAHSCTAAVVASSSREVVVTAAHCVAGTGAGLAFAAAFRQVLAEQSGPRG